MPLSSHGLSGDPEGPLLPQQTDLCLGAVERQGAKPPRLLRPSAAVLMLLPLPAAACAPQPQPPRGRHQTSADLAEEQEHSELSQAWACLLLLPQQLTLGQTGPLSSRAEGGQWANPGRVGLDLLFSPVGGSSPAAPHLGLDCPSDFSSPAPAPCAPTNRSGILQHRFPVSGFHTAPMGHRPCTSPQFGSFSQPQPHGCRLC